MDKKLHLIKIAGVPSDFDSLPFGRQIEHFRAIEAWKVDAKHDWLSQKRQPYKKAIKEFLRATGAKEYYISFFPKQAGCQMWDDTFQIFFKV